MGSARQDERLEKVNLTNVNADLSAGEASAHRASASFPASAKCAAVNPRWGGSLAAALEEVKPQPKLSNGVALLFAPFPRRLHMSCPYTATIVPGLLLRANVVRRIASIRESMAASDQPELNIFAPNPTVRDGSSVAVNVPLSTRYRRLSDKLVQGHRSFLSTAIGRVCGIKTRLPLFRRVDPMEADAPIHGSRSHRRRRPRLAPRCRRGRRQRTLPECNDERTRQHANFQLSS